MTMSFRACAVALDIPSMTPSGEFVVDDKMASSIAWDDYDGPLKFEVPPG